MNSSVPEIQWPEAPAETPLAGREVHLWAASLQVPAEALRIFSTILSDDERQRAGRFKFDLHRNRFIAGRGFVRTILARTLSVAPESLGFAYSKQGKPELVPMPGCSPLHFNLAHTGDLAVLGVSRLGPLGVDVETIRPVKDADDLVARFFSPRESESFQRLTSDRKVNAFFNLWTRKEALLKASGEGISGGLNRTEVSFLPGEPARVIAIDEQAARTPWTLEAFTPAVGFVGAVAIRQDGVQFRSWKFRPLARLDVRN